MGLRESNPYSTVSSGTQPLDYESILIGKHSPLIHTCQKNGVPMWVSCEIFDILIAMRVGYSSLNDDYFSGCLLFHALRSRCVEISSHNIVEHDSGYQD